LSSWVKSSEGGEEEDPALVETGFGEGNVDSLADGCGQGAIIIGLGYIMGCC